MAKPLYELGELPEFLDDLKWPEAPAIDRTEQVQGARDLHRVARRGGTKAIVPPGNYGDLNISGDDIHLLLGAGVNLSSLTISGHRVRIEGGRMNGGPLDLAAASDLALISFHGITRRQANNWTSSGRPFERVALVNSTLEVEDGRSGGDWTIFMMPKGSRDLIVAGSRLDNDGGQLVRFQGLDNLVIVDSVFNGNGTAANGLRLHQGMTDVLIRDSNIVGAFIVNFPSYQGVELQRAQFLRVARYIDTGLVDGCWHQLGIDRVESVEVRDSPCFTTHTVTPHGLEMSGREATIGTASGSGNVIHPWNGEPLRIPATGAAQ